MRLYYALFTMLSFTSLRFGDTRWAQALWLSDTALCGASICNKNKTGQIINWATPLIGPGAKTRWYEPIIKFWPNVQPKGGKSEGLFPNMPPGGKSTTIGQPLSGSSRKTRYYPKGMWFFDRMQNAFVSKLGIRVCAPIALFPRGKRNDRALGPGQQNARSIR